MEAIVLWLVITSNPVRYAEPRVIEVSTKAACVQLAEEKKSAYGSAWCVPLIKEKSNERH